MAFLQISEPGQSAEPHQRKLAVGIDLGTTNSLVASVFSGEARTLADEQGEHMLPSVVYYGTDNIIVGHEAKLSQAKYPKDTLSSVKRFLGKSAEEIERLYPHLPYGIVSGKDELPNIETSSKVVSPVQVSADILSKLKQRAEDTLAGDLDGAVITVPAYFDDGQRQATKDAAKIAGIHILRLLNEPTAAAIAYGLESGNEGIIAIYDLGGGTFDISILRLSKGVFEVLATGGDTGLGGDDFDAAIANWALEQFSIELGQQTAEFKSQLHIAARQAKETLTGSESAQFELTDHIGTCHQAELTRAEFESLIAPLVKKTLRSCKRAMKDAKVTSSEIMEVVMVGGSTRVPAIRDGVENFFGQKPLTSIDPDKVVAIGAARQADTLVGNNKESMLLLDVIPLSLGIETMGGLVEKIIPRNTTIPVAKAQEFTTFKDGQTAMLIHVFQGERELTKDCRSLAKFTLQGIPPMAAGAAHIRVTFQVDADGLLEVTAMEKSTKVEASIQVKPSYGLSDEQITDMIKDSMSNADSDMQARMRAEQVVEAKRVLETLGQAMRKDGETLLSAEEKERIEAAMHSLKLLLEKGSTQELENGIEALDQLTQDFAARRMDNSIKQALTGQSIDKV